MYDDISKRLDEYVGRIKEYEEKEDHDSILKLVEEYRVYLEGLLAYEQNPINRSWYHTLKIYLALLQKNSQILKTMKERDRAYTSEINSLREDVNNLKKRIEAIEKGV